MGALRSNTAGTSNVAVGYQALYGNTTGFINTAVGYQALNFNSTGAGNTASGAQSLYTNTTGVNNTASGVQALASNATGNWNTATGYQSLYANMASANTANGYHALNQNTTGSGNTASGAQSLYTNTTGGNNTAIGRDALGSSTGSSNVAVGENAGSSVTSGSYNVHLGAGVTGASNDTNTIRIGAGQNQTFIAGIYGTQLTGPANQVFVDANGQLGTLTPGIATGTAIIRPSLIAGTSLLSLVDANGGFVAPVTDTFLSSNPSQVRVALTVGGVLAIAAVGRDLWFGNYGGNVLFQSTDCSGPAYIEVLAELAVYPPTVVVNNVPGAQVLYVADNTAAPLTGQTYQSELNPFQSNCIAVATVRSFALPVVSTLDTSTLGPPPYRVVRTP